jgi:hypothetical protein
MPTPTQERSTVPLVLVAAGSASTVASRCIWLLRGACPTICSGKRRRPASRRVRGRVRGDFTGDPAVSTEITYEVDVEGDAPAGRLRALVEDVDRIAEIPNSLRGGTRVRLTGTNAVPTAT